MKPSNRRTAPTFPAASATGCAAPDLRQTLKPQTLTPRRSAGGFHGFRGYLLRTNSFISLLAASLIALLPTHALAQTSPNAPGQAPELTPSQQVDEAVRQGPVSVRDRERPEFDSEGRRVGAFVLNATLDLAVTSTDNLFAAPDGSEFDDIIYNVTPMAYLESDWSRHMLAFEAGAGFRSHEDFSGEDSDTHYLRALGRLDVGSDTNLRASARTAHQVTPRTDPDSPFTGSPVEYDRVDASVGFDHRFAFMTVSGDFTHSEYDYEGSQDDRDNDHDMFRGRLEWQAAPRLGVFVQASTDERDYDNLSTASSEAQTYLVGLALDGDLFRGELSAGQFEREYDDPTIGTLDGLAVAAQLDWFVTQLTTVSFTARRDADDQISVATRLPYISEEYGARIDHELLRNVILTASARLGERDYEVDLPDPRHDDFSEAEIGADWLVNRNTAVRLRYERDEVNSSGNPASRDYEVNAVTLGLTLRL